MRQRRVCLAVRGNSIAGAVTDVPILADAVVAGLSATGDPDVVIHQWSRACSGSRTSGLGGSRAEPRRAMSLFFRRKWDGGRDRDRTCDPYDVNVVLSR